jgi:osomolarity two-component system sensor histidine kinase NIK1
MKILVAEDNALNQKIMKAFLSRNNHEVTIASDGKELVDMFSTGDFDCILVDLHMPFMDGFEATESIRRTEKGRHIPIIAVTASCPQEDRLKCLSMGMNDFLQKPVKYEEIEHIIKKIEQGLYKH